jgi:transposase InsO family protein
MIHSDPMPGPAIGVRRREYPAGAVVPHLTLALQDRRQLGGDRLLALAGRSAISGPVLLRFAPDGGVAGDPRPLPQLQAGARLMRLLGLAAIYQRPNTCKPAVAHKVYPYLLGGIAIERANQVWCSDLTYIPIAKGFLYLVAGVAAVDYAGRRFLCRCAQRGAHPLRPAVDLFNTDQGSQFTSEAFTGTLQRHGVTISMEGKGRVFRGKSAADSDMSRPLIPI